MTDTKHIIIDGEIYNPCDGCELWNGYHCTGDKSYEPNGEKHTIVCDRHMAQQFWKIKNELARKTQECEKLKEKLYRIEDVVEPINKQLPEDIIIRQIMLILNDCNNLEPSYYQKALQDVQNLAQSILDDFESDDIEQQLSYCQDIARHIINIIGKFAKGYINE